MSAPSFELEADPDWVRAVLVKASEDLRMAMRHVRRTFPMAIRAEGINYIVRQPEPAPGRRRFHRPVASCLV